MRSKAVVVFVAIPIIIALGFCMLGTAQEVDKPVPTPGNTEQVAVPPTTILPLFDCILKPNGKWMTMYAGEPVDRATIVFNLTALIATANRQQTEIQDLKKQVQELRDSIAKTEVK